MLLIGLAGTTKMTEMFLNNGMYLTLFLLSMTCPILANSVDPDQLASEEAS